MDISILGVISEGLELLNKFVPDQATVIANKISALYARWDVEYAKKDKRDDAMLDSIELELRDIRELYRAAISAAVAKAG